MKSNNKIFSWFFLFLTFIVFCCSCNTKGKTQTDNTDRMIDSLILINRINERTIIIQFGSDAVTAVNTKNGIVVVDAGRSTGLTKKYRKIIEKEFNSTNFLYVINSHGHHDHNRGNQVFKEAKVIGHKNIKTDVAEQWKNPEKVAASIRKTVKGYDSQLKMLKPGSEEWKEAFISKTLYQFALDDAEVFTPVIQPEITFSDSNTVKVDDMTFEMLYFGKFHSESDIMIFIPELKILFTGDLFSKYGRPSINDSTGIDKVNWIRGVRWMEKRTGNIEKIVGGHGQLLSVDDLISFNQKILSY